MAVIAVFVLTAIVAGTDLSTTEAVFPGTNGRIVFTDLTNFDGKLTTMNPDGSDRTLIPIENDDGDFPAFGPDGRTIVFRGSDNVLTAGFERGL